MLDISFDLLGSIEVRGMRAEVRHFATQPSYERIWEAPSHILSYRMSPGSALWSRQVSTQPMKYTPVGPLAYRSRSTVWESKSNGRATLSVMAFLDDAALSAVQFGHAEPVTIDELSVMELMRLLHDEIRTPGFASTAMVESIAEILSIKLARLADLRTSVREPAALDRGVIALIRDYVTAQKGRSPSVSELAALCNLSRRTLLRRFKAATGATVAAYVAQLQLDRAKALLASSNMEIKQIAHEAGFASPSRFSIAFKRATGMTPKGFRRLAAGS